MPNGELKGLVEDVKDLKSSVSELKFTLLNPDNGVIVNTNKNSEFRREMERNKNDYQNKMIDLEEIKRWREGVNKALWIVFTILAGVVIRIMAEIMGKV